MSSRTLADPLEQLHQRASTQHGVITAADVADAGLSRSQLRTQLRHGLLTAKYRGIYVATAHPATWQQRVAVAAIAHVACASHRCAARLHRLDGFADAPVEVTATKDRQQRDASVVLHRTRRPVGPSMVTVVDGIPTTSVARTLVDLGAVVNDDLVEQALDDALRRGFNLRWITETLADSVRPGRTGCAALQRVLARPDRNGPIPDSVFERILLQILSASAVDAFDRQITVHDESGQQFARIDAGIADLKVGIEADSEMWHWGPRRGRRAITRHNRLTSMGWLMIYVSWQDVKNSTDLIEQVTAAVTERSR